MIISNCLLRVNMYNHIITICSYIIMMHNQANVSGIMLERSSEISWKKKWFSLWKLQDCFMLNMRTRFPRAGALDIQQSQNILNLNKWSRWLLEMLLEEKQTKPRKLNLRKWFLSKKCSIINMADMKSLSLSIL